MTRKHIQRLSVAGKTR